MNLKEKVLEYSFKFKKSHIPSALSQVEYLFEVFKNIDLKSNIIIGKPFGSQAYYVIFEELGILKNTEKLSDIVMAKEIPFIDFNCETIGHSLGIAIGCAMCSDKLTYVNLSDASLQSGDAYEALLTLNKFSNLNIFITIDYNNMQVNGKISDILDINPLFAFLKSSNIKFKIGNKSDIKKFLELKGVRILFVKNNIDWFKEHNWHYKTILNEDELNELKRHI